MIRNDVKINMINKIFFLGRHVKAVTGGHKYNEAFERVLEDLSGIKISKIPSCAHTLTGWRKILSPFFELKRLGEFNKNTLIIYGDSSYKYYFLQVIINKLFFNAHTTVIVHHFLFLGTTGLKASINKWLMLNFYSLLDSIIVPSPFTLDVAKSLFPKKVIHYIPLPFERKYTPSNNYQEGNFLYVGTIERRKGLMYLINAIGKLPFKDKVVLNVVGKVVDPKYFSELKESIKELNLSDQVYFLGRVSDEQLAECYQKAEIFTFPSLLEGYGIVLIEALNKGVPVVCFNNTAMPYSIKDGVNGFLAINKDVDDLAKKLSYLSFNKEARFLLQNGIKESMMNIKTQEDFEKGIRLFYNHINS